PSSIVHDVAPHILESTIFPLSDHEVMSTKTGADIVASDNENSSDETVGTREVQVGYVPGEIDELISNVKTVAFGMGIGTKEGAKAILFHLLDKFGGTLIIDADGLNILAKFDRQTIRRSACDIVLTPHIKEFSRLCGLDVEKIQEDPIETAKDYAKDTNTTVLLKGPSTVVTDGDRVFITDRGCAGMATAGSGDVLSGIAAAVCAYGRRKTSSGYEKDNCMAAAVSAYINGAAGELAQERYGDISMTAGDTVSFIPDIIKVLQQ
nr:NAD(P)H-hydrate dehydratase [Lachnospiraceae bacterium]